MLAITRKTMNDLNGTSDDLEGLINFPLTVKDIEAEVVRLQEQGVQFISPVQVWEKTGKKLVYFHGPDGILLEFAEYPA